MNIIGKGYDFDDLLLVPTASEINSRNRVDLHAEFTTNWGNIFITEFPIISAPMKGISGPRLVRTLSELGGIGILHRFFSDEISWKTAIKDSVPDTGRGIWGVSIGLDTDLELINYALGMGAKIICIDIANGYLKSLQQAINHLKNSFPDYDFAIMAGNVATLSGSDALAHSGATLIRVGIGSGALCTTRNMTGVGVPQLTAIYNCNRGLAGEFDMVVADGGIRNSGDAVKALAMGASYVMLGSLLGGVAESENNGIIYGMASRRLQEEYYHTTKSVEGIEKVIQKGGTLQEFLDEFTWNMKSAFTYLNAVDITELQMNTSWIETGTGTIKKL